MHELIGLLSTYLEERADALSEHELGFAVELSTAALLEHVVDAARRCIGHWRRTEALYTSA